jgi:hypothetical protein
MLMVDIRTMWSRLSGNAISPIGSDHLHALEKTLSHVHMLFTVVSHAVVGASLIPAVFAIASM